MKEREQEKRLDTPSESNTEKHINFMEVEEESARRSENDNHDQIADERRKQWQEGLKEGEAARQKD